MRARRINGAALVLGALFLTVGVSRLAKIGNDLKVMRRIIGTDLYQMMLADNTPGFSSDFIDTLSGNPSISIAYESPDVSIQRADALLRIHHKFVSANYFHHQGYKLQSGRFPENSGECVIGSDFHRFLLTHPELMTKTLRVAGENLTVTGVLEPIPEFRENEQRLNHFVFRFFETDLEEDITMLWIRSDEPEEQLREVIESIDHAMQYQLTEYSIAYGIEKRMERQISMVFLIAVIIFIFILIINIFLLAFREILGRRGEIAVKRLVGASSLQLTGEYMRASFLSDLISVATGFVGGIIILFFVSTERTLEQLQILQAAGGCLVLLLFVNSATCLAILRVCFADPLRSLRLHRERRVAAASGDVSGNLPAALAAFVAVAISLFLVSSVHGLSHWEHVRTATFNRVVSASTWDIREYSLLAFPNLTCEKISDVMERSGCIDSISCVQGKNQFATIDVEDRRRIGATYTDAIYNQVMQFELSGNWFTERDVQTGRSVTIISRKLAENLSLGLSDILTSDRHPAAEVIGIVDGYVWGTTEHAFFPIQSDDMRSLQYMIKIRENVQIADVLPDILLAFQQAYDSTGIPVLRWYTGRYNSAFAALWQSASGYLGAFAVLLMVYNLTGTLFFLAAALLQVSRAIGIKIVLGVGFFRLVREVLPGEGGMVLAAILSGTVVGVMSMVLLSRRLPYLLLPDALSVVLPCIAVILYIVCLFLYLLHAVRKGDMIDFIRERQ